MSCTAFFSWPLLYLHRINQNVMTEWGKQWKGSPNYRHNLILLGICRNNLLCDIIIVTDIILYTLAKWCHQDSVVCAVIDPSAFYFFCFLSHSRAPLMVSCSGHSTTSLGLFQTLKDATSDWRSALDSCLSSHSLKLNCKVTMMKLI